MMKVLFVAILSTAGFAGTLHAQSMTTPPSEWNGGFAGVQLSFGDVQVDELGGGIVDLDGNGSLFGVNVGYNHDFGRFVLGGELQYDRTGIDIEFDGIATGDQIKSVFRAGVRAGYDAGRFLPYLTGGYVTASLTGLNGDGDIMGGYYGVGVDYKLNERIVLGAQILNHDFNKISGENLTSSNLDAGLSTVTLRATFNF
jgi:outer membrane immunogenic protein